MILETTRGDGSDILIYSENRFDLENNFRMIRKHIGINNPIRIHYNEVCSYVNDLQPKTVVAYRLLTNLDDFDINYVKYGQQVQINAAREVIYFDPIYCIKEMEDNGFLKEDPDLRFRIQQVGLKSKGVEDGIAHFEESYSFDLEATEVQNQNDRSFAELLCAFDEIDFDRVISNLSTNEVIDSPKAEIPKPEPQGPKATKFQALTSEDLGFQKKDSAETPSPLAKSWSAKSTNLFEEDSYYDPYKAGQRVHLKDARIGSNTQAEISPGTTDQRSARFTVVGQGRPKSPFASTQVLGRTEAAKNEGNKRSFFSAFLEKKREDLASKKVEETANAHDEITDSVKEFASDREKRFVVLKLRKDKL